MSLWIVAAMAEELSLLIAATGARLNGWLCGSPWFAGAVGNCAVNLGVTGVGITSACMTLGAICIMHQPDLMVMVGSAGSLPDSGLGKGDMVVAETEILAELGVVAGPGIGDAQAMKLPGVIQEIQLDQEVSAHLFDHAGNLGKAAYGRSLTVAGASADHHQAGDRARHFRALAENMEGYALALAGERFGFRTAEIRGISNEAGDRDKSRWDFEGAIVPGQKVLLEYLRKKY